METKEWRHTDKSGYGPGEWQDEPDKVQWVDEATGLPCLIVRGPVGALCGYVGVHASHPWFAVSYSSCSNKIPCEESYCDHVPSNYVQVHGGLTYSNFCMDSTREQWEAFRKRINSPEHLAEVAKYPRGDAAQYEQRMRPFVDDFEGWLRQREARSICHLPGPGEPDRVWWFGFDCAHYGDIAPSLREFGLGSLTYGGESYKNIRYVKDQVASLARQLAEHR